MQMSNMCMQKKQTTACNKKRIHTCDTIYNCNKKDICVTKIINPAKKYAFNIDLLDKKIYIKI